MRSIGPTPQKRQPGLLTQFQISKGSPSNTKSNGNSIPDLKKEAPAILIKWKLNSRSQKGSSCNTKSNGNSIPDLKILKSKLNSRSHMEAPASNTKWKLSSSNTKSSGNSAPAILNQMELNSRLFRGGGVAKNLPKFCPPQNLLTFKGGGGAGGTD